MCVEWISVKEKLPEEGREVLLFDRVVQNTLYYIVDTVNDGLIWNSNNENLDEPVPLYEHQQWIYPERVAPP